MISARVFAFQSKSAVEIGCHNLNCLLTIETMTYIVDGARHKKIANRSQSIHALRGQISRLTTSFMISDVPPKIRVTRASRHKRAMAYSFI